MIIEKVRLKTADGLTLFGLLHKGKKQSKSVIISVHGMQSNIFKDREWIESEYFVEKGIDYLCFNNRGSEVFTKIKKSTPDFKDKINCGCMWENVCDGVYDIDSSIDLLIDKGYDNIILQGHSLGSVKSVLYYNYLVENNLENKLEKIKGIILLSLVGIKEFLENKEKEGTERRMKFIEEERKNGREPFIELFGFFQTAETFLQFFNKEELNFPRYLDKKYNFHQLNVIRCPLFMRYGNVQEIIPLEVNEIVKIVNKKVQNPNKDISYIDGANHSFKNKEKILAEEIYKFICDKIDIKE